MSPGTARCRSPLSRSLSLTNGRLTGLLRKKDVTCKSTRRTLRRFDVAHALRGSPLRRNLSLTNSRLPGLDCAGDLRCESLCLQPRLPDLRPSLPNSAQGKFFSAPQGTLPRHNRTRDLLPQSVCLGTRLLQCPNAGFGKTSAAIKIRLEVPDTLSSHVEGAKLIRSEAGNLLFWEIYSFGHQAIGQLREARDVLIFSGNLNSAAANKTRVFPNELRWLGLRLTLSRGLRLSRSRSLSLGLPLVTTFGLTTTLINTRGRGRTLGRGRGRTLSRGRGRTLSRSRSRG